MAKSLATHNCNQFVGVPCENIGTVSSVVVSFITYNIPIFIYRATTPRISFQIFINYILSFVHLSISISLLDKVTKFYSYDLENVFFHFMVNRRKKCDLQSFAAFIACPRR